MPEIPVAMGMRAGPRVTRPKTPTALIALALAAVIDPSATFAQPVPLADYLATMDRTEVSLDGEIGYDPSEDDFTYYNAEGEPFPATMDTGREAREAIETGCQTRTFMVSREQLCAIVATGSVEIRGSRIHVSVENVERLKEGQSE